MATKHKISERTLYLISLVVAAIFLGNIYYQLHIAPGWQWGPAIDKMPRHMISDFRAEIYENNKGGYALAEFIDPKAEFDRAAFPELADNSGYKSTLVRPMIGDGRDVVVFHKLEKAGEAPKTVIDFIHIGPRGGRIDQMIRYVVEE